MKCLYKICNNEVTFRGKFCSYKCKNKYYVDKRRRDLKTRAVEYLGGHCIVCGYDRLEAALSFHHLGLEQKEFKISDGCTRSWEKLVKELDKCVLVCCRCHVEIHVGLITLATEERLELP